MAELSGFCVFSQKRQNGSVLNFFSEFKFKRKHLFISACIEEHCTGPFDQTPVGSL